MNQKTTLAAMAGFLLSTATAAALDDCPASFFCPLASEAAGLTVRVNVLTPNIRRSWSWLTLFDARLLRVNGPKEGRTLFSVA